MSVHEFTVVQLIQLHQSHPRFLLFSVTIFHAGSYDGERHPYSLSCPLSLVWSIGSLTSEHTCQWAQHLRDVLNKYDM